MLTAKKMAARMAKASTRAIADEGNFLIVDVLDADGKSGLTMVLVPLAVRR